MKINFEKPFIFLGAIEKTSKKGNVYNVSSVMVDGAVNSVYCNENLSVSSLSFGDKKNGIFEVTINEKYDKLELINIL